ncbi:MAG: NAD-dependent epimerase/dehydratase family protein [Saprospiraceae bacterium]|nr:NAD-dependent epimerase/dehydratase family protein [Saprospiraceae bacterium]
MTTGNILVIGANGQIGTVLTETLRNAHGNDRVIASDLAPAATAAHGPFETLDILNAVRLGEIIRQYDIRQVYHLAAILSATGEQHPQWAWDVNMGGLFNVLEAAREYRLKVFFPSSIASFGPFAERQNTPQHGPLEPTTVYGISKVAGELWSQYYFLRYGVDVRSLRYPGIISYQSMPGGGTTDYAVEIFHKAVLEEPFTCFLRDDTRLPMMYMDDAVRATLLLMEAPAEQVKLHTSYNLSGMSFTPAELSAAIRAHYPGFEVQYQPDFRQGIADSWPESIDDTDARHDWGWAPSFDLQAMTLEMLTRLREKYGR